MPETSQATSARNRLAKESSPYLRQHADNPVDWYPWGEEAFERARAENKPILLSVGYSACHWCHVMAHESFEDPEIARLMNELFINVKVDREERPDLDQVYQGVVLLMGRGGGGWPLTVFLTPNLRPFFGGTYFPPEDRFGMPGFPRLLRTLHEAWIQKPEEVQAQVAQFQAGLDRLATYGLDAEPAELATRDILTAAQKLEREIDRVHGGFGSAPKFPNPMCLAVLLRAYRRAGTATLMSGVSLTLERMARGGVYDQVGGGFHRYSVDERWLVPHFEKMLYDSAQLLHLYAEAYQLEPRPLWRRTIEETVEYVRREMTHPGGGFYATQDADSEGKEGKFFVWTAGEVDALLPPEQAELVKLRFNITPEGNFEEHASVLELRRTVRELAAHLSLTTQQVEERLAAARRAMFEAREERVKPGRDEKILAGWNGLMIRGLAFAARVLQQPEWTKLARSAADFVLSEMWRDGRLLHCHQEGASRIDGLLEDYGGLAAGLTALFQATFEPKYLEAAEALAAKAVELFWDDRREAYLSAPRGQKDLITAPFAVHDNAYPSGASTLTEAQVALASITGKSAYLEQAGRYLRRMHEEMLRNPMGHGHLLVAGDSWLDGATSLTLVGEPAGIAPFLELLGHTYAPTVAVVAGPPGGPGAPSLEETFKGKPPVDGKAAAYLCHHFTCEPPLTEPAELKGRIARMGAVPVTEFPKAPPPGSSPSGGRRPQAPGSPSSR